MVHRGKLSAACGPCRSRRLKCDQKRPFCSQCIRAKRECSGYRDVTAGRFYDQTEEVKQKNSSASPPDSPNSSSSLTLSPNKRRYEPSPSPVGQELSFPLTEQGTAFMLSRFLGHDSLNQARGPLASVLPNVLTSPSGRAVAASLNAVGLAALSNIHQSSQLRNNARQEYVTALAATNSVLGDPIESTSNATLVAVTFLSMFELMTCNGPPLMERYLNHIHGSERLLQLRGPSQLRDSVGLGLFTQFRQTIILGNFYLKRTTPSWLIDLSHEAIVCQGGNSTEDELFLLMARVGDLCAGLKDGRPPDPVRFAQQALKLDAEFGAWSMSVEPSRCYTLVDVPERADGGTGHSPYQHIHGKYYHIYPDPVSSSWWSDYRLARLLLLELICYFCDYLARKDESTSSHYRQAITHSTAVSRQLTEDVCASVPYHMGATAENPNENWSSPKTGGTLRLIWPLFIATDCVGASPQTAEWIADTLFKIGNVVGVQQAVVMAYSIRAGRVLYWMPDLE
ncbi:Zn(II)2Cys6 transcription factor [Aspergillus stella-maris]|uniref:Zn(II)2Cys6 transcription factor n=1 Tax=Aspergillus stella-maris TaxID=1810926 RepID=UPI003CCDF091